MKALFFYTYAKPVRIYSHRFKGINIYVLSHYVVSSCYPDTRPENVCCRIESTKERDRIRIPTMHKFKYGDRIKPTLELKKILAQYPQIKIDEKRARYVL